jgi:serine/threonine protein kinase
MRRQHFLPGMVVRDDYFIEWPLLAMTLVPGPDLGQRLGERAAPFDIASVLRWADELLDALGYLHTRRIVHHDIKPRNIRLDADGRAMLVDFGLAQHVSALGDGGDFGYTAAYAPPEQVRGKPTDGRSDLYALAATMYELLVRTSPPPALSRAGAVEAGDADPLLALDVIDPTMPRRVTDLVGKALSLDPAARPASARAMQQALRLARLEVMASPRQITARPAIACTRHERAGTDSDTAPLPVTSR